MRHQRSGKKLGREGTFHARRQALAYLRTQEVVHKLFSEVAPRFVGRPGGYTRIVKQHYRRLGDASPTAIVELLKEGEQKHRLKERKPAAPAPAPVTATAAGQAEAPAT